MNTTAPIADPLSKVISAALADAFRQKTPHRNTTVTGGAM